LIELTDVQQLPVSIGKLYVREAE